MKESAKGQLSSKDLGKGAIMAIIGAAITSAYTILQPLASGTPINFGSNTLATIGAGAALAGISYIAKNWQSNSDGKFMGVEPSKPDTDKAE